MVSDHARSCARNRNVGVAVGAIVGSAVLAGEGVGVVTAVGCGVAVVVSVGVAVADVDGGGAASPLSLLRRRNRPKAIAARPPTKANVNRAVRNGLLPFP